MKGLASDVSNALNDYKSTIHTNKRDVLVALRVAAKRTNTNDSTTKPEIENNSDAQDKADRQNVFRLAAISVKEVIVEGITKIVGRDIMKPIIRTTDNINFKSVDQFHIHQLFTAITEGAERTESSKIWQHFVNIARKFFDRR